MTSYYEYDIYLWLPSNGMNKMICIPNLPFDQCLKIQKKWKFKFKGDCGIIIHGLTPCFVESNVAVQNIYDMMNVYLNEISVSSNETH